MLGILYTFWGMGFLIFMKKGSSFLLGVMWAKFRVQHLRFRVSGLGFGVQGSFKGLRFEVLQGYLRWGFYGIPSKGLI